MKARKLDLREKVFSQKQDLEKKSFLFSEYSTKGTRLDIQAQKVVPQTQNG